MPSDSDAFLRKVLDIYNSHDVSRFDELLADDCVLVRNGVEARGREEVKRVLARLYAAIPDIEYRLDDVVAAGDKLALRWSGRGTHRGEYMGVAPTGRPLSYDGITLYERRGDRLQRIWVSTNLLGLLRALTTGTGTPAEARPE
jgi:predicted ester cyclase